jgi:ubiquitin-protein ligase E3 C
MFAAHSLNWYRFIGRILGKAMYDGILVEVAFAPFFLAKVGLLWVPSKRS